MMTNAAWTRPIAALAIAVSAMCGATHAAEAPPDRWRLEDLYPSIAAWEAEARQIEARAGEIAACRGRLGDSARRLAECLDLNAALAERMERLGAYAALLSDEDTGLSAPLELRQRAELLSSRLDEATAFLRPELIALGRPTIERFSAEEPALRKHRQPLNVVLRGADHTLDARGESLLATLGPVTSGGGAAYSILSNAELPWPKVRLSDGTEVQLDQAAYGKYRQSLDRGDRKRTMQTFFGTWKAFERTFGVTFYESLKRDTAYAKVRSYPDSLAHRLDSDNLPRAVIDMLVAQTNANLPTLHRYLRLRARMLKLSDLGYSGCYSPLVRVASTFPLDAQRSADAGRPAAPRRRLRLGDRRRTAIRLDGRLSAAAQAERRLRRRRVRRAPVPAAEPQRRLRVADDARARVGPRDALRTWPTRPSRSSRRTTRSSSPRSRRPSTRRCSLDHMLKTARSDDERLFYLGSALETLRATFFRQAMFAEFEREAHARVDQGEPLTGEALTSSTPSSCAATTATSDGVMQIDDLYASSGRTSRTSTARSTCSSTRPRSPPARCSPTRSSRARPARRERYLELLRAGGSDDPYELVKAAGVDLAAPAPYRR